MGLRFYSYCFILFWYRLPPWAGRGGQKDSGVGARIARRLDDDHPLSVARGTCSTEAGSILAAASWVR